MTDDRPEAYALSRCICDHDAHFESACLATHSQFITLPTNELQRRSSVNGGH
jgi:hypothetical protein